jgi:hypothetical protein
VLWPLSHISVHSPNHKALIKAMRARLGCMAVSRASLGDVSRCCAILAVETCRAKPQRCHLSSSLTARSKGLEQFAPAPLLPLQARNRAEELTV